MYKNGLRRARTIQSSRFLTAVCHVRAEYRSHVHASAVCGVVGQTVEPICIAAQLIAVHGAGAADGDGKTVCLISFLKATTPATVAAIADPVPRTDGSRKP